MNPPDESKKPAPRRMAPPPAISARSTVSAHGSGRWRIKDGFLEIESGAVLPNICIYGSPDGEPGQRIALSIPYDYHDGEAPEEVRFTAWQSTRRARRLRIRRALLQFLMPPPVGYLVWHFFHPPSYVVICAMGVTFGVFSKIAQRRGLTVMRTEEPGWWLVLGSHRKARARLRQIDEQRITQDLF